MFAHLLFVFMSLGPLQQRAVKAFSCSQPHFLQALGLRSIIAGRQQPPPRTPALIFGP